MPGITVGWDRGHGVIGLPRPADASIGRPRSGPGTTIVFGQNIADTSVTIPVCMRRATDCKFTIQTENTVLDATRTDLEALGFPSPSGLVLRPKRKLRSEDGMISRSWPRVSRRGRRSYRRPCGSTRSDCDQGQVAQSIEGLPHNQLRRSADFLFEVVFEYSKKNQFLPLPAWSELGWLVLYRHPDPLVDGRRARWCSSRGAPDGASHLSLPGRPIHQ